MGFPTAVLALAAACGGGGLLGPAPPPTSVTITGNAGAPMAVLAYMNGAPMTVTADGSGNYTFYVPPGWSGTVTPSLSGYTFQPASRTYTSLADGQNGQNYTVATRPVAGTMKVTWLPYDSGTQTITPSTLPVTSATVQAVLADGTVLAGTYDPASGAFSVGNVPPGAVTLVCAGGGTTAAVVTGQAQVDMGWPQQGRTGVRYPTGSTLVAFNITGMTGAQAWSGNDYLRFYDWNSGLHCTPDADSVSGYPADGATALSGLTVDWWSNPEGPLALVDTTKGDAPVLEQLSDAWSPYGNGPTPTSHLARAGNAWQPSPLTISDRAGATLDGAFTYQPLSATVLVAFQRSAFATGAADVNASAVLQPPFFEVDDGPGLATYGYLGPALDRLKYWDSAVADASTDVNLGTAALPAVFPGFQREYLAGAHSQITFLLAGTTASATFDDPALMVFTLTPPITALAPLVTPPRNLSVGGTSLVNGNGILATGVGTTPTLAWDAPASGTPQGYRVAVYQAAAANSATVLTGPVLELFTAGTQARVPPGILAQGGTYFFVVRAIADPAYSPATAPQRYGTFPFGWADNVTGLVQP
jgi:hypothetical protein